MNRKDLAYVNELEARIANLTRQVGDLRQDIRHNNQEPRDRLDALCAWLGVRLSYKLAGGNHWKVIELD